jgi:Family of unknown function (DUF5990)
MEREIPVRITVVQPPKGVTFRLQQGKSDLVAPAQALEDRLSFDFTLRVVGDPAKDPPNFRGLCAQGPSVGRFVYVNSGTSAGQAGSCWTRRAKVPLAGISWELIGQVLARPAAVLEARIRGTGKDGGPACATVPLLEGRWLVAHATPQQAGLDPDGVQA